MLATLTKLGEITTNMVSEAGPRTIRNGITVMLVEIPIPFPPFLDQPQHVLRVYAEHTASTSYMLPEVGEVDASQLVCNSTLYCWFS